MHTNKKIDLTIKVILTILAVISGVTAFILNFPNKTVPLAVIYGILYLVAAITFWFQDRNKFIRVLMEVSLVLTFLLSLTQSTADIPLGVPTDGTSWILIRAVVMALPSIIGLIYFNLDSFSSGSKVLLVFLHLLVTFIFAYLAFLTILILTISGAFILGMPTWMQNVTIAAFYIIALYYVVYIICNWLQFYRGIVAWVMTLVALIAFIPVGYIGGFMISDFWWLGIIVVIVLFTTYWNNHVKNQDY